MLCPQTELAFITYMFSCWTSDIQNNFTCINIILMMNLRDTALHTELKLQKIYVWKIA